MWTACLEITDIYWQKFRENNVFNFLIKKFLKNWFHGKNFGERCTGNLKNISWNWFRIAITRFFRQTNGSVLLKKLQMSWFHGNFLSEIAVFIIIWYTQWKIFDNIDAKIGSLNIFFVKSTQNIFSLKNVAEIYVKMTHMKYKFVKLTRFSWNWRVFSWNWRNFTWHYFSP